MSKPQCLMVRGGPLHGQRFDAKLLELASFSPREDGRFVRCAYQRRAIGIDTSYVPIATDEVDALPDGAERCATGNNFYIIKNTGDA